MSTVDRALMILSLFSISENESLGVTEIAGKTGLSKAVVHRILSSFLVNGFVETDEFRRYRLGTSALYLGLAYLDRLDIGNLARPVIESLSKATNETSTLSIRIGSSRVYIDQVTPDRDVKMVVQLGKPWPLHAGASSKAFLAFLDEDRIDEYLSGPLEQLTTSTITSQEALREEIAVIRRKGFAISDGERLEGAASVAAPVLGLDGQPVAVISVSGPAERLMSQFSSAARLLVAATTDLSKRTGYLDSSNRSKKKSRFR